MISSEIKEIIDQALHKALEYYKTKDFLNAEILYRQILRVDPKNTEALEMGSLVISEHNPREAIDLISSLSTYQALNNLALIQSKIGDHWNATQNLRKAICLAPDVTYLKTNLALEYKKMGDYDLAFEILEEAPDCEHVNFNYGAILQEVGQLEKAIYFYKKANSPLSHYNLSACYFLLGDYEKAYPEYEWRWKCFPHFAKRPEPLWDGKSRNVVFYNEQGDGDTIMMSRFLPKEAILECSTDLIELMRTNGINACSKFEGKADYQCSLMSLPMVLGITPSSRNSYLRSSVETNEWCYAGKKIGICWTGNPQHPNDRNRSCPLSYFKIDGTIFSFQKDTRPHHYPGIGTIDYAANANIKFIDLREHMTDYNRTAALLQKMDLVITVDTSIAHLAGALGVKTILLLPYMPDWRWGIKGNQTHWYDSVHLVRQKKAGDWEGVWEEIILQQDNLPMMSDSLSIFPPCF